MWNWVRALDSVLRGEATRPARLRDGQVPVPLGGLAVLCVVLGAIYGFCMGWFALVNRDKPEYAQVLASMIKVPALFLLTLLVTLPSLYVFNALAGSRLGGLALLRLLVASLSVTLAVLASFGPIVAFFSLTTNSYPFMLLLNVVVFAVAGALGLGFLLQTMHRLTLPERPSRPPVRTRDRDEDEDEPAGALDRLPGRPPGRNVRAVFACWVVVFGLVGAQMSWVLRPFVGAPDRPFEWFRARESNFFQAVRNTLADLFR
jgi:hypothetical protein